jgi:hypothetical protein
MGTSSCKEPDLGTRSCSATCGGGINEGVEVEALMGMVSAGNLAFSREFPDVGGRIKGGADMTCLCISCLTLGLFSIQLTEAGIQSSLLNTTQCTTYRPVQDRQLAMLFSFTQVKYTWRGKIFVTAATRASLYQINPKSPLAVCAVGQIYPVLTTVRRIFLRQSYKLVAGPITNSPQLNRY